MLWSSAVSARMVIASPCARCGSRRCSPRSVIVAALLVAARKPGNVTTVPLAVKKVATRRRWWRPGAKVVVATLASVIWEAMVRFHTSSYRASSSC